MYNRQKCERRHFFNSYENTFGDTYRFGDWVTFKRHLNVVIVTESVTIVTEIKTGYWRRRFKSVLSNDLFKSQCESKHSKLSIILISLRVIKAISKNIYCNMTSFYIMPININNILVNLYNNFCILLTYRL